MHVCCAHLWETGGMHFIICSKFFSFNSMLSHVYLWNNKFQSLIIFGNDENVVLFNLMLIQEQGATTRNRLRPGSKLLASRGQATESHLVLSYLTLISTVGETPGGVRCQVWGRAWRPSILLSAPRFWFLRIRVYEEDQSFGKKPIVWTFIKQIFTRD